MRTMRSLAILGAAGALLAACDAERERATSPSGGVAYGTSFAIGATNLPRGTIRIPRPATVASPTLDSIVLTLQGLDSLASPAAYVVWLGDSLGTSWKKATGDFARSVID